MTARRRFPVVATLIVTLAVAAMIALGLWQLLDRLPKKEAFLAQLAANPARAAVPFPQVDDDRLLFRRSVGVCRPPVDVKLFGAGAAGYRAIARCALAGPTPGLTVQLGTTRDPNARVSWRGGAVAGLIAHQPDSRPLLSFDGRPTPLMLVADRPVAGLAPSPRPRLDGIPNNHLAYAGQWFFFAAVAAIIFILATRRRQR